MTNPNPNPNPMRPWSTTQAERRRRLTHPWPSPFPAHVPCHSYRLLRAYTRLLFHSTKLVAAFITHQRCLPAGLPHLLKLIRVSSVINCRNFYLNCQLNLCLIQIDP